VALDALTSSEYLHPDYVGAADSLFYTHFLRLPDPAYIWQRVQDEKFRLVAYNCAAAELPGSAIDSIRGVELTELYPAGSIFIHHVTDCAERQSRIDWEGDFRFVTGDIRSMAFNYLPLSRDIVVVHGKDLTNKRAAEAAIILSENRFKALVESMPDLIFRMDDEGRFLDFHKPEGMQVQWTAEELIGRTVRDFHGEEAHIAQVQLSKLAIETGEVQSAKYSIDQFGRTDFFESRFSSAGKHEVVVSVRDITEQMLVERELALLDERERNRVGRDIHEQLAQMLAGVKFIVESLERQLNEEGSQYTATASQGVELLDATILHARRLARRLRPIPEGLTLKEGLTQLKVLTADAHGVDCSVDYQPSDLKLSEVASLHYFRIAEEAVGNSIKHGNAKRIEIGCRVAEGEFELKVVDDGSGIEDQPGDNGLGLRIMKHRASAMGGTISLETVAGGSTTLICRCRLHLLTD
jgi:two-component system CheB/CheR fusion protein